MCFHWSRQPWDKKALVIYVRTLTISLHTWTTAHTICPTPGFLKMLGETYAPQRRRKRFFCRSLQFSSAAIVARSFDSCFLHQPHSKESTDGLLPSLKRYHDASQIRPAPEKTHVGCDFKEGTKRTGLPTTKSRKYRVSQFVVLIPGLTDWLTYYHLSFCVGRAG